VGISSILASIVATLALSSIIKYLHQIACIRKARAEADGFTFV
jgi:hypothetical protein